MKKPLKRQLACAWAVQSPATSRVSAVLPLRGTPQPALQPGPFRQAKAYFERQGGMVTPTQGHARSLPGAVRRAAKPQLVQAGGWLALWSWTRYTLGKRHRGERQAFASQRALRALSHPS
ncbi:MAG: hypothetical protein V4739_04210 [Pseudomonadota bacterium]